MKVTTAQALLKAAEMRKNSYDNEKANAAITTAENLIGLNEFYTLSLLGACSKAGEEFGLDDNEINWIYSLSWNIWNESIKYAERVISKNK